MSEGPYDVVSWGPFALPGERKGLQDAEARRVEEVNQSRAAADREIVQRVVRVLDDTRHDHEMSLDEFRLLIEKALH